MFKDLIEYEKIYKACGECFGFGVVKFKRDFGFAKAGEIYPLVWFQLETGICEIYQEDGITLISSFPIKLEATN